MPPSSDWTEKEKERLWFEGLRDRICSVFEELEQEYSALNPERALVPGKFQREAWTHAQGGGGIMAIMRGGCLFEKVGVNVSTVWGEFSPQFRGEIPGTQEDSSFWASGLSLVAHMASPLIPAVHMNTRSIRTKKTWFGGGIDLTPYYPFDDDTKDFHDHLKKMCDAFDVTYYPKYKKWCDDYFFLPHRNEPRGVGGIFYDYMNSGSWENDFLFTQRVGETFLDIYPMIVRRRLPLAWTEEQRQTQLVRRGRYVEFNLLYDRGTRFGLMTQGHTEAILMSLPPEVRWP